MRSRRELSIPAPSAGASIDTEAVTATRGSRRMRIMVAFARDAFSGIVSESSRRVGVTGAVMRRRAEVARANVVTMNDQFLQHDPWIDHPDLQGVHARSVDCVRGSQF